MVRPPTALALPTLVLLGELHLLLWALFAALCTVATLADPLALWGDPLGLARATGFRAAEYQEEPFRQATIARRQPEILVLGTSRVRAYLSAGACVQPAYNAAIGGTHIEDLARMTRWALAQPRPPKHLVLELHPWIFQGRPPRRPLWWDELPERVRTWWQLCGHHQAWRLAGQRLHALQEPRPLAYAPDGQGVSLDVRHRPDGQPDQLLHQWKRYTNNFLPNPPTKSFSREAWQAYTQILEHGRRRGVKVHVIFPPCHILERVGLEHGLGLRELSHWKTRVVREARSAWDFGGLEGIKVARPSPALHEQFLDPSHAQAFCSPWIWARLGLAGPLAAPPDWGRRLTKREVAPAEAMAHQVAQAWLKRHGPLLEAQGWQLHRLKAKP